MLFFPILEAPTRSRGKPLVVSFSFFLKKHKRIEKQMNSSNPPANMRNLSKMVAQMWEQESPEVKQYWDQVAERIKLNSSYRSSFDVINGLDMSISESDITFVNATASSSQSATKKNKKTKSTTTLPIQS
ncbi:unnamed protein product [Rhizophagus irregularis]|nr:unnamed protein product [Rhizophagus irregularis]CAB5365971.1 unnamed protein product [Rhizophagus irregularis]